MTGTIEVTSRQVPAWSEGADENDLFNGVLTSASILRQRTEWGSKL
jgi:hypothetical protein